MHLHPSSIYIAVYCILLSPLPSRSHTTYSCMHLPPSYMATHYTLPIALHTAHSWKVGSTYRLIQPSPACAHDLPHIHSIPIQTPPFIHLHWQCCGERGKDVTNLLNPVKGPPTGL